MLDLPWVPRARSEISLLIAFADITHYTSIARRLEERALADFADAFYERVEAKVDATGGVVVKFIGDAALIVYPENRADEGVRALLELKHEIDHWLTGQHLEARLLIKVGFGSVIAGPFGGRDKKRFDVIGQEVNAAASLETRSFALSVSAFRKLEPETRKRFKKHTPPVTYIPVDSARP
jgi:class 3 adenylate cyclase